MLARTAAGDEEDVAVGGNPNDKPELTSFGDAGDRHFETGAVRECGLVLFVTCEVPKAQTSCVVCRIAAGADAVACVFHSSMELIHGGASIAM